MSMLPLTSEAIEGTKRLVSLGEYVPAWKSVKGSGSPPCAVGAVRTS